MTQTAVDSQRINAQRPFRWFLGMALCAGVVLAGVVTASMFWSRHVTERDRTLGLRLAAIGNYQEADPLLRRALELNPDDIETIGALTRGRLPSATFAGAEPLLNRWCALAPDDAAPFKLRMDFYHRQARAASAAAEALRLTRAALVDGQHVLTLDPRDDSVAQEVIWLLMQVERFDEADERCRACLQRRPNDPWLTYLLAKISHSRGQATQAQVLLDALLLQHPLFARGLLLRAALHNEAGEPERAVGLLRQLLAFDHTLRNETRYQLSLALARSGKTDEARRVMAEVQKHNLDHILATTPMPDTSAMKLHKAEVLLAVDCADEGLQLLTELLEHEPYLIAAHQLLAVYYEQHGQPERAAQHRHKANGPKSPGR